MIFLCSGLDTAGLHLLQPRATTLSLNPTNQRPRLTPYPKPSSLSIYLSMYLSIHPPSIHPSIHSSMHASIHSFIHASIQPASQPASQPAGYCVRGFTDDHLRPRFALPASRDMRSLGSGAPILCASHVFLLCRSA